MDAIKKWNSRLEKFWFIIAIVATGLAFFISIYDYLQTNSLDGVEAYFLLALMSWGIYFIRRGLRKRLSKNS
jgi:hypothetical protein